MNDEYKEQETAEHKEVDTGSEDTKFQETISKAFEDLKNNQNYYKSLTILNSNREKISFDDDSVSFLFNIFPNIHSVAETTIYIHLITYVIDNYNRIILELPVYFQDLIIYLKGDELPPESLFTRFRNHEFMKFRQVYADFCFLFYKLMEKYQELMNPYYDDYISLLIRNMNLLDQPNLVDISFDYFVKLIESSSIENIDFMLISISMLDSKDKFITISLKICQKGEEFLAEYQRHMSIDNIFDCLDDGLTLYSSFFDLLAKYVKSNDESCDFLYNKQDFYDICHQLIVNSPKYFLDNYLPHILDLLRDMIIKIGDNFVQKLFENLIFHELLRLNTKYSDVASIADFMLNLFNSDIISNDFRSKLINLGIIEIIENSFESGVTELCRLSINAIEITYELNPSSISAFVNENLDMEFDDEQNDEMWFNFCKSHDLLE
ncbi:hypothetical protein TVAG_248870 [Trichomonas vaginalis G3]|uniref:Uncharacterized protein n=1 Tax=Trichomonas vaginalis (strain ATCC PRA-98 / G3) TaxID=412133 RepID=A2DC91_TRIV3|nr:hypothetical protein TVAGG3_0958020 [Trichomonas vaginalis G3]EAY21828.1 hypothetical protein TVAG_248870 [Trichomonas vaginalis G3]KAI5487702.1 hypothetical protein TVAGG3_0958020 [Trichomonas vaginalis G3]|eukprot:XP_001582814.1 hypothetical protein [Trichomonas vaginalis G3]